LHVNGTNFIDRLQVESTFHQEDLLSVQPFEIAGGKGLVSVVGPRIPTSVIVSYRGSGMTPADFIRNLNYAKTKFPFLRYRDDRMEVHAGFFKLYTALRVVFFKQFNNWFKTLPQGIPIIFTGHSLGGALATLNALEFKERHPKLNVQLITFASPRVGNQEFANYVNEQIPRIHRWVQENDLVSRLPPISFGYQHTKGEIWWNGKAPTCCSSESESLQCSLQVPRTKLSVERHCFLKSNLRFGRGHCKRIQKLPFLSR
jgi:uncharacterized protein (DUF433 family)